MIGTRTPCLSSSSTIRGTAAAASSLFTVTRTSSDPALASAATCCTVEGTSAVSVLVMDCTTTGASDPTRTPPTTAVTVFLRWIVAIGGIDSLTRGFRRLPGTPSAPSQRRSLPLGFAGQVYPYRFHRVWHRHRTNFAGKTLRRP